MTLRIHHTVAKQAAKFNITLKIAADKVAAMHDGKIVATGATASEALANAITALGLTTKQTMTKLRSAKPKKAKSKKRKARKSDDEDGEEGEDEEGDGEGKSVVKRKYKNMYRPHKMTCGDALSKQIRTEFMTVKDPDTNKLKLDWVKLTEFAKKNDCWSSEYSKLNKGLRRMNIVNRLRAKTKKKHEVVWN